MKIYHAKDYQEMSRMAANLLAAQITLKPDSVLGLATGSSPLEVYDRLAMRCRQKDLDFGRITTVNLDEYKGLAPQDPQSYRYFMDTHLFSRVNIAKNRTFVPDGLEEDGAKACENYETILDSLGPVDMQLLGLGHNGHIGFNEPADAFPALTHQVDLTASTIDANRRFFTSASAVPRQAYTMGIGSIMRARKILVIVSGSAKARILKEAVNGPISPLVPASILQLHPDVTVIADEAALSLF